MACRVCAQLASGAGDSRGRRWRGIWTSFFLFCSLFLFDLVLGSGGGIFRLVIVVVDTLAKMERR